MQHAIVKAIVASVLLGTMMAGIGLACFLVQLPGSLDYARKTVFEWVIFPLLWFHHFVPVVFQNLGKLPPWPYTACWTVILAIIWSLAFMLVLVPVACILGGRKKPC